jgi:hypothetical protein
MKILDYGIGIYLKLQFRSCLGNRQYWQEQQEKTWKQTLRSLKGTIIYHDLNLEEIQSYQQYINDIELKDYDDYAPYIAKILKGEKNVLFQGINNFFGLTSGTSGQDSKKIPYNEKTIQCFQKAQKTMGGLVCEHDNMRPFSSTRFTYGSNPLCENDGKFNYGYISGFLSSRLPKFLARNTYPKAQYLEIEDWDEKLSRIMETTINKDVEILGGIPTYMITIFEKMLEKTGKKTISEIWPNVHTFIYGATPITQYQERLNQLVGRNLNYYGIYASTEAPLGLPVNNAAYAPQEYTFVPGILYSFNPINNPKKVIGIDQLEKGKKYLLNIGAPNGFLQYQMKDVIRVVRVEPFVSFDVLGREGGQLNLAAEKTSEKHLLDSVEQTAKELNLRIDHHMVFPNEEKKRPSYAWTMFVQEPLNIDKEELLNKLEDHLQQFNPDYQDCRLDRIIDAPSIKILPSSELKKYFHKNKDKGQFKMKTTFPNQKSFMEFFLSNFGQQFTF